MLKLILPVILSGCAIKAGSTAITQQDIQGHNPVYANLDVSQELA